MGRRQVRTSWLEVQKGWTGLEPGHYVQRVGGGLLRGECTAQWSELGGEAWSVGWRSCRLTLLGLRVWRHDALRADADFDYDVWPTFVDGDLCVLRSPAVVAGGKNLRSPEALLKHDEKQCASSPAKVFARSAAELPGPAAQSTVK